MNSSKPHLENAETPMVVTLSGSSIDVKAVQLLKAESGIVVTPGSIITSVRSAQL